MSYRDQFYQRYISTHFGAIRGISIQACENQVDIFRSYFKEHLPKNTQAKVLDIGCGYGSFLYFLRKEGFQDVHGVEISTEQVAAAKRLGIPNVSCNDIIDYLKDNPETFDCVVALDVIEHFPKSELCKLIGLAFQALRRGGKIIIQVPNGGSPFCGMIRYGDFTHETCFTRNSVVQILEMGGFTNSRVFPTGPVVHGVKSAVRWCLWQFCNVLLKTYLVIETGSFRGHIISLNLIAVAEKP